MLHAPQAGRRSTRHSAGRSRRRDRQIKPAIGFIALLLTLIAPNFCAAQSDGASSKNVIADTADADDLRLAKVYGLLVYRTVTVDFDQTPAREALDIIKRQASLPIVVRWSTDAMGAGGMGGMGIDPDTPISYAADNESAQEVLEEVLRQCGAPSTRRECTWQIRRGFIEVGTKQRLAVPAARTSRLYDVGDLMIEAPDFGGGDVRKSPLQLAVELVEEICETVEPGHWDFGQPLPPAPLDPDRLIRQPEGPNAAPAEAPPPSTPSSKDSKPASAMPAGATSQPAANSSVAPVSPNVRWNWASIRIWRTQLLVVAPDFMHRQIGGYPKPIPPDDDVESATTPTGDDAMNSRSKGRQP